MSVRYATISAMRAAATSGFSTTVANTCYVDSVGDFFQFRAGDTTAPVSNAIVPSSDALGNWRRMGIANQTFVAAPYFSVDPSGGTGSDENAGWGATQAQADARPLATFHELNRRLIGRGDSALTIHVMSASDSTNFTVLTNLASDGGSQQYVTLYGDLIPIDSTATGRAITARQVAVPASNTQRTITIAGLGLVPQYVGMLVQTAGGGKTAVVMSQPSSNVLAISQPRSCDIYGDTGSVVDFVVGDVVGFYDCTPLPDYPFPPDYPLYPLVGNVRLDLGTSGVFPSGQVGGSHAIFSQCIFGSDSDPSACLLRSDHGNTDVAPFIVCCALRRRRVHFAGSWNFQSVGIAVRGVGSNGGDGPRILSGTIFIDSELAAESAGNLFSAHSSSWFRIFFGTGSSLSTFNCTGYIFGGAGVGAFDLSAITAWYGTNPAIAPSNTIFAHTLLEVGPGAASRLPLDTSTLTVTVGGTGKRVALTENLAVLDFADAPISNGGGIALGMDGITPINRGKHIVGGTTCISYGDQSPASDTVPLTWSVGDRRYAVGAAAGAIAYWRCSVAGTPGTWVAFP